MKNDLTPPMQKLFAFLSKNQTVYECFQHAECRTSEESFKARVAAGAPPAIGAKALLIKAELKGKPSVFYLLVLPGPSKADKKCLKAAIPDLKGFELASREEIASIMDGLVPGSVPPFGSELFANIEKTWIDSSLFQHEFIGFNAACLTQSVVMRATEYQRITQGNIIAFVRNEGKPET